MSDHFETTSGYVVGGRYFSNKMSTDCTFLLYQICDCEIPALFETVIITCERLVP